MDLNTLIEWVMTLVNAPLKILNKLDQSFNMFDWTDILF